MLAVVIGYFSILVGLGILFLPLIITELSRPKDSAWGALIIVLGLILVTSSNRFIGTPMLAVLFGSLVICRLGLEVSQSRWQQLSSEERLRVQSTERWFTSIKELGHVFLGLGRSIKELMNIFQSNSKRVSKNKKWIRPDPDTQKTSPKTIEKKE